MPPIFNRFKTKETAVISAHDFQALFERFYPSVHKQVYFLTHDKVAAEDIAQETFIKLYHSCPVSLKNPGAWLNTVATNLTYNYLKGELTRRVKETTPELRLASATETSEDVVVRREQNETVRAVLSSLPVKDRMCLTLRFSGFSYEEIADVLQIPKSSVGKTLARAQSKFKTAYTRLKGSGI